MVWGLASSVAFLAALSLLVTACGATSANTLAQDLAYERYMNCRYVTNNAILNRIDRDGTVWIRMDNGTAAYQEWRECMRREQEKQATARASAPSPAPGASGAGASSTSAGATGSSLVPLPASIATPTWAPGEEWAYRWESPSGKGTYIESVDRMEQIDGVAHIVIKMGSRELYYRAVDGVLMLQKISGEVSRRYAPGWETVSFPLSVGKRWETRYTDEVVADRKTSEVVRTCVANAEEEVAVPAGTFATVVIVCTNTRTDQVVYRLWYAPAVKHIVRWVWELSRGVDTRELIAYKVR